MLLVERVRILNVMGPTENCSVSVASSSCRPGFQVAPQRGDRGRGSRYRALTILSRSGFMAFMPRSASTGSKQKREYSRVASLLLFFPPPLAAPLSLPPPPPPLGLEAPSVSKPSVVFFLP